ncbi:unnamed protein product [Pedinophyceae sp. YPF-701]|nr:unnamed protein product [Pedinophyceae sp. YPF-701]
MVFTKTAKPVDAAAATMVYPEGKGPLNATGLAGLPVVPNEGTVFRSKAPHNLKPTEIDDKDKGTPDDWIPRHPDIVRLTGRHPLNCEPPMQTLMETGFNTPPALHYVRNHGPAPRIKWEDHRITVNGLVDKPITYTMEELMKLPQRTIPVTLVCAGNRRKEQNMIKKTIGFSWGSAGLGTSYWTGVRLGDILRASGVKPGATHVCFRGPKKELPQGDDGSYATSLELPVAMDPAEDVMVCWKQDGELLTPDHGYPVRMIIPGFIGGRMVKWLEEITVTDKESDNFYHFFDNRVLPPQIDQKRANEEGWWYKPEYIINQLNINSAIGYPAHGEVLPLDGSVQEYTVRGYAYTGGGRKIIRCEVSLDDGKTWRLADIHRFQKPTEFGKFWCWDFWSIKIPLADVVRCKEICCRAFDAAQNTQPAWPTWTVMGMMNNPWFRVRVNPCVLESGKAAVTFQHPTQPANQPGGWMGDNPTET